MLSPEVQPHSLLRSIAAICALLMLAACSFAPVYGVGGRTYDLQFSSPDTRLEQIVYQDLVTRFGRSNDPSALLITVKISSSSLLGTTLEGVVTITRPDPTGVADGEVLYRTVRTASATRRDAQQSLADQQSSIDAAERAAHQLAESVRLTLLGVLTEDGVVTPAPATPQ